MGRTFRNPRDLEEDNSSKKKLKHSRNIPGKGMRILNDYEDLDSDDDFDDDLYDEYNVNTSQHYANRRK